MPACHVERPARRLNHNRYQDCVKGADQLSASHFVIGRGELDMQAKREAEKENLHATLDIRSL
jgi:hypothetical protein